MVLTSLLLGHSNSSSSSSSCLGMLSSYSKTPVMSQSSVCFDLLESLKILSKLVVKSIRSNLRKLAILDVSLSIQEPVGYLKLSRIIDDSHKSLDFVFIEFSCSLRKIDVCLLAAHVGKSSSNSSNGRQCVHDVPLTVDVGV